jgi:hypothetical protein
MGLYKNVADQKIAVFAYDTAVGVPKTGDASNITAQISKDFGSAAALADVNPIELDATDHPGIYVFDLTKAETNADNIIITAVSTTPDVECDPVQVLMLVGNNVMGGANGGSSVTSMAVNAQQIITSALRLIGAVASGETLEPDEANDGLVVLNDFIDELRTQRLTIYITQHQVYPLTAAKQSYTIGTGGDFNQQRPLWIPYAGLIIDNAADVPTEIGINVYSVQEYAGVYQKALQSTLTQAVYYDHGWDASGLGRLYLYPVPSVGTTSLVLYTPLAINEFANLTTRYTFPPGYRKMLKYNLAVQLAAEYGRQVDPMVLDIARSSMANVKASNASQPGLMRVDTGLVGTKSGWNWRTGSSAARGAGR